MAQLKDVGLKDLGINVHYQGDRVYEAARRLATAYHMDIRISQEESLLDTGGGLRRGVQLLGDARHILVHNADTILDFDLTKLINSHLTSGAAATLLMIPEKGPRTVRLADDGTILDFRKPRHTGNATFAGVHIFRRDILDLLPEQPVCSIIDAYERALERKMPVRAYLARQDTYWADLGTTDQYIRAHGEIADCALEYHPALREAQAEQARRRAALEQKDVQCTGALGLGLELGVPAGSHLHNVVLWDYTRLPKPLLYADGIFVGEDVKPPRPVDRDRKPDPRIYAALDLDPRKAALIPLQKQGSGRRYCRLDGPADRSWVWCAYDPERRENAAFAAIADFLLRLGVRVPQVVLHLADAFELVSRDLGQHDLLRVVPMDKSRFLVQVVRQIARLHVMGDEAARLEELPLRPGFTKGLYDWERDYFREHALGKVLNRPELWTMAAREYCQLRGALLAQPLVPIHRDLQSANIMIVDNQVHLIDFQGMRLGCAAYDLGALLYDPYQCYDRPLRQRAWHEYCQCTVELGGAPPADDILCAAAFQRLMQALGAYGKLWLSDGLEWYRAFIVPGFRMLLAAACDSGQYPSLREFAATCLELALLRLDEGVDA